MALSAISPLSSTLALSANKDSFMAYKATFMIVKDHLNRLVNPYVAQDILEQFKKYNSGLMLDTNNMYDDFRSHSLPRETQDLLQSFSEKIRIYNYTDVLPIEVPRIFENIKQDLEELVQETEPLILAKIDQDSRELRILLNMPEIKKEDNHFVSSCLELIHSRNREGLKEKIRIFLQKPIEVHEYLRKQEWYQGIEELIDGIFEPMRNNEKKIVLFPSDPLSIKVTELSAQNFAQGFSARSSCQKHEEWIPFSGKTFYLDDIEVKTQCCDRQPYHKLKMVILSECTFTVTFRVKEKYGGGQFNRTFLMKEGVARKIENFKTLVYVQIEIKGELNKTSTK